jgi:transketolase
VILIAAGSEVNPAVQAHEQLRAEGIRSRVVSRPSWVVEAAKVVLGKNRP